jgi:hypothetical protein
MPALGGKPDTSPVSNGRDAEVREYQFRRLLSRFLTEESANSYVAYAKRVERELQSDLDQLDLSEHGCGNLASRLLARGVPKKSVQNCMSALRAYARLDSRQ